MSYRFDTLAIHAGQANDEATGAVTVPIYQTSTFEQLEPGVSRGYDYSRTAHPTRRALEENLAALEGPGFGRRFPTAMPPTLTGCRFRARADHGAPARAFKGAPGG